MTPKQFIKKLESFHEDYLCDEFIENRLHKDRYINALLMMAPFSNNDTQILSASEHDAIYLDVNIKKLCKSEPSDTFIRDMVRTGISYEEDYDCFMMNV